MKPLTNCTANTQSTCGSLGVKAKSEYCSGVRSAALH